MYINQEIQSFSSTSIPRVLDYSSVYVWSSVLLTSYNYMEESLKGDSMMFG